MSKELLMSMASSQGVLPEASEVLQLYLGVEWETWLYNPSVKSC